MAQLENPFFLEGERESELTMFHLVFVCSKRESGAGKGGDESEGADKREGASDLSDMLRAPQTFTSQNSQKIMRYQVFA